MNKTLYSILFFFLLLLSTLPSLASDYAGITAVASTGKEVNSQVSKIAARAPYYLFFDEQNQLLGSEKNPHAEADRGAGPKAADYLAGKKVQRVIAGQFGRKMLSRLQYYKIKTVNRQGRVIDAVKEQSNE